MDYYVEPVGAEKPGVLVVEGNDPFGAAIPIAEAYPDVDRWKVWWDEDGKRKHRYLVVPRG